MSSILEQAWNRCKTWLVAPITICVTIAPMVICCQLVVIITVPHWFQSWVRTLLTACAVTSSTVKARPWEWETPRSGSVWLLHIVWHKYVLSSLVGFYHQVNTASYTQTFSPTPCLALLAPLLSFSPYTTCTLSFLWKLLSWPLTIFLFSMGTPD